MSNTETKPAPATDDAIEAELTAAYRRANPSSRIVGIIKYVRNGSAAVQRGCVLCGEDGPGWCGRWPRTKQSIAWEKAHVALHVAEARKAR